MLLSGSYIRNLSELGYEKVTYNNTNLSVSSMRFYLVKLSNQFKNSLTVKTSGNIFINSVSGSEIYFREIIKSFGVPLYSFRTIIDEYKITSVYYKKYFGEFKTRVELQFYKNRLFHYCYKFPDVNETQIESIKKMLTRKYHLENTIEVNQVIEGANGNRFFINDEERFVIHYMVANVFFEEYQYQEERKKIQKHIEIKMGVKELYKQL